MFHLPGSAAGDATGGDATGGETTGGETTGGETGGLAGRARGALYGLAIGDALGMPTQLMPRPEIVRRWGPMLGGFEPAPHGHPIAAGQPAGAVTDDTEQAVLLGRLLVAGGGTVEAEALAGALVAWEADMAARGSADLLGPSTRRAVAAVRAGTPPEVAGASGDTNGAAMRIAPVGIATSIEGGLGPLVDRVVAASYVSHGTGLALAGAAAVAAAVSAGISGAPVAGAIEAGVAAARLAAGRGHWVAGADVAARIEWATGLVAGRPASEAADLIYRLVGTSRATQESVPAAFAVLSVLPDDPWRMCHLAASLGGDTDTIAAMAGAIGGACHGEDVFPAEAIAMIDAHGLDLPGLAAGLLALRQSPSAAHPGGDPVSDPDLPTRPIRRLVFAGEALVDLVMRIPALPERGGDMIATSAGPAVGGGFNIMAAAARHGLPVLYAGGHGSGPWGDLVRSALAAEGIAVLRPPDRRSDTGFDVALVERGGERTFVTSLGAETLREPGSWDAVPIGAGDAVYISGYGLASAASGPVLGEWAASLPRGVLLFADPGPLIAEIPAAVLGPVRARCDWWSCNEREARASTGVADPAEAARRLLSQAGGADHGRRDSPPGVIVRTGATGCVLARGDQITHIPAPRVVAVDTTGAGDAHSGVFLAGLAGGLAPVDAARRANAAAALSVTRPGPATSPARAELDAWLAARA